MPDFTINKDNIIRRKFHAGYRRRSYRGDKVKEIVIHGTGGGGTLNWVRHGGRADEYYRGVALFHYLIQRDGKIWEIIDPDRWVYHSSSRRKDANRIGIEVVNLDYGNRGPYENVQYESLNWLMYEYLMERYPSIHVILSHRRSMEKYSKGRRTKNCPGEGFEWDKVEEYMDINGISYKHINGIESYWGICK